MGIRAQYVKLLFKSFLAAHLSAEFTGKLKGNQAIILSQACFAQCGSCTKLYAENINRVT